MDRPENIPEDVWTAATAANWCLFNLSEQDQRNGADIEIIARAILAAKAEEREAIIQVCEAEKVAFLSPEYASPQPVGSICERFAIDECIAAIRERGNVSTVRKSENQEG